MKKIPLLLGSLLMCASCGHANNSYNKKTASTDTNPGGDGRITAQVKGVLNSDSALAGGERLVSVETMDGVVTLTGNAPSADESRNIERKVKEVNGVRRVDNQLIIKP